MRFQCCVILRGKVKGASTYFRMDLAFTINILSDVESEYTINETESEIQEEEQKIETEVE